MSHDTTVRPPGEVEGRPRPRPRRAVTGRALAVAAFVAATLVSPTGVVSPADARNWSEGICPDETGVTVVVDFRDLGGSTIVRCAHGSQDTGLHALENAGIQVTGTNRWGKSFVCRLEGEPGVGTEPCVDTPPATAYWSYWHALNGESWIYSDFGVRNRKPPEGSFEGWSFYRGAADGNLPTGYQRPRVEPVRPRPDPPPPSVGDGDGGSSGGGGGSHGGGSSGSSGGSSGSSGSSSGSSGSSSGSGSEGNGSTSNGSDGASSSSTNPGNGGSGDDGEGSSSDDGGETVDTDEPDAGEDRDDDAHDADEPDGDADGEADEEEAAADDDADDDQDRDLATRETITDDDTLAASTVEIRTGGGMSSTLAGVGLVALLGAVAGGVAWRRRTADGD